jgi:hypothetical protein
MVAWDPVIALQGTPVQSLQEPSIVLPIISHQTAKPDGRLGQDWLIRTSRSSNVEIHTITVEGLTIGPIPEATGTAEPAEQSNVGQASGVSFKVVVDEPGRYTQHSMLTQVGSGSDFTGDGPGLAEEHKRESSFNDGAISLEACSVQELTKNTSP